MMGKHRKALAVGAGLLAFAVAVAVAVAAAPAGKAKVTFYANRITSPEVATAQYGTGATVLEVPGFARVSVSQCADDAHVEVERLNGETDRVILDASPGSLAFAPIPPEGRVEVAEGPGWHPFLVTFGNEANTQIGTFRVERGTGSATTVAAFTIDAYAQGVAATGECVFAATADVYKG